MEYEPEKRQIIFSEKALNELDRFTLNFTRILKKYSGFVIVSGYVSILLGRIRSSEDIDLLVPKMDFFIFSDLFSELMNKDYECANTSNIKEAYEMLNTHAIRFFKIGSPVPNIEFKTIKTDLDRYSFDNKVKVIFGENILFISPLELQIAYKLFLASEGDDDEISSDKDIEDAKHLYKLFKDKLDKDEFYLFLDKLKAREKMRWLE